MKYVLGEHEEACILMMSMALKETCTTILSIPTSHSLYIDNAVLLQDSGSGGKRRQKGILLSS